MEINEDGSDGEKSSVAWGDKPSPLAQTASAQLLAVSLAGCMALDKSLKGHRMCPGFQSEDSNIVLPPQSMR